MVRSFSSRFLKSFGSPKWSSASVAIWITHQFGTQSSKPVTQSSKAVSQCRHRQITSPDSGEPPVIRSTDIPPPKPMDPSTSGFPSKEVLEQLSHQYRSLETAKKSRDEKNVPQIYNFQDFVSRCRLTLKKSPKLWSVMFLGMGSIQEFHEPKKTGGKSCSFSQPTEIWSDYWSWLRHQCTTPHGLGRSSAKHLRNRKKKKTKPFK